MSYALDTEIAKQADKVNVSIRESGKYVGVITRAEALVSEKGTRGLGLSFQAIDGATSDYLDLYTHNKDGEPLSALKTVNAILACLALRSINEAPIQCEKWNSADKKRERVTVNGYPELMGRKIGLLLQRELTSHSMTGNDSERMNIFGVFSAASELTASEILERKTTPERLPKMLEALMARPVRDSRVKRAGKTHGQMRQESRADASGGGFSSMDDDIPF